MYDTIHGLIRRYTKEILKDNIGKVVGLLKGLFTKIICRNIGLLYIMIQIVNFHILTSCGKGLLFTTVSTEKRC